MQEFIAAGTVTRLLHPVNFAGQPHRPEIKVTPAFRSSEEVKASRIQVNGSKLLILNSIFYLHTTPNPKKFLTSRLLWAIF
jgi:hypothetical protein